MSRCGLWVAAAILLALLLLLSACTEHQVGDPSPATVTLCLPTDSSWMPLTTELAVTPEARRQGLAGRERLPRRQGMLFLYPQEQGPDNQFWMHNTNMPLTVAFMKADGGIAALQGMSPCLYEDGDECPRYAARVRHRAALEVNQGLFDALGVAVGDRITMDPSSRRDCQERVPFSMEALLSNH